MFSRLEGKERTLDLHIRNGTGRDGHWMGEALRLAERAWKAGDVPVGAVLVRGGEVLGRGFNQREAATDPTAHAEILALREAAEKVDLWRLDGATMYVTLEPCPMCAGALVNARIGRLVYGASDPKGGACGSLYEIPRDPRLNHRIPTTAGVLAEESASLLRGFFEEKRKSARAVRRPSDI